jgi:hypothetical protein
MLKGRICFATALILLLLGSFAALEVNAMLLFDDDLSTSFWLHTSGTRILDAKDQEVVFNGVSTMTLFGYEAYPPVYPAIYSPSNMDIIRQYGLNLVRLDVALNCAVYGVDPALQTPTNITFNPQFFPTLDGLVARCAELGLWVNICFVTSGAALTGMGGWWGMGNGFPKWIFDGSWDYFSKRYDLPYDGWTVDACRDSLRDFWDIEQPVDEPLRTLYQTYMKDIAFHFRDSANVIFGLWNEPMIHGGAPNPFPSRSEQTRVAQMYKAFMEQTVDIIRSEAPYNLIFVNDAYFEYWETNPKIDRPNIVVENHAYQAINPYNDSENNPLGDVDYFINLGWRYNQPFFLGEFGGIEEGNLQDKAGTLNNIQYCNLKGVSWSYLSFRPWGNSWNPSTDTWELLEGNLVQGIQYYGVVSNSGSDIIPNFPPTSASDYTSLPTATPNSTDVPASPTPTPSQSPAPSTSPTPTPEPTKTPTETPAAVIAPEIFAATAAGITCIVAIAIVALKRRKK